MKKKPKKQSYQRLSVIVPENPFSPKKLKKIGHCLCALEVEKLIEWWPGKPHSPHRKAEKVRSIQRSLDWKRVAQIAAYLLQEEIYDTDEKINQYFQEIYEPIKYEPGREWPPRVKKVTKYEKSAFPVFSNILLHINGARIESDERVSGDDKKMAAHLIFNENDENLNFFVIDGQHRINGAFFALKILKEKKPKIKWEIPSQIFLDLDQIDEPPKRQAQIFIDVNFYQKKVDRSLVADLFPTTRVGRESIDDKEKAQDIGRKMMLEIGPLVGMIQIPGIKFGVKDVVTLATLNTAIEDIVKWLNENYVIGLEAQTEFIAKVLACWFEATGRFEGGRKKKTSKLESDNVVYQGRVLVSVIDLIPAIFWKLQKEKVKPNHTNVSKILTKWFKALIKKANLEEKGRFISKSKFKQKGYLGSGGIGRFRNTLWASIRGTDLYGLKPEAITIRAEKNKEIVYKALKSS